MLYTDAGGVLGARIGEFPVASVTPGVWSGYFAYHNYGSLDPNETAIIITKGRTYWLAVEPLSDTSLVYWAASLSTKPTKQFRNGRRMPASNRRHFENLALDELDSFVLTEDPGFRHAEIAFGIDLDGPGSEHGAHRACRVAS